MSASNTNVTPYVIIVVIIVVMIRRIFRVMRGSKVNKTLTIAYSIFYLAFGGFFIGFSFLSGVPLIYGIVYVIVGFLGAIGSFYYSDKRIGFWKGKDGSIYFKGGIVIYLIYIAGLIARIAIDIILVPSALTFSSSSVSLSSTALNAEIITDLILAAGIGLLIGRNARVMKRYSLIMQGKEKVSDTPPEIKFI